MDKYLNLLEEKIICWAKYYGLSIFLFFFTQKIYCYGSFKAQCKMNNLFAEKKQPTLSAHIITNLHCNWHIYLLTAYLCSTFACGWASAGGVKWTVANVINGGELGIFRLKPLTFLLSRLMKVINTSVIRTYTVGTD